MKLDRVTIDEFIKKYTFDGCFEDAIELIDTLKPKIYKASIDGFRFEYIINNSLNELFNYLIDNGCSPYIKTSLYDVLIDYVLNEEKYHMTKKLLDNGVPIGSIGELQIINIIKFKDIKISELLLDYGLDVNYSDKFGVTLLMYSVLSGRGNVVELLIKKGADVNLVDFKGQNALFYLTNYDPEKVIRMISDKLIRTGINYNQIDELNNTFYDELNKNTIQIVKQVLRKYKIKHIL